MKIKHSIKLLPDTKQPDVYISWQGVKILITYGRDGHTKWHFKRQFAALSLLLYRTSFSDHLTESHWFSLHLELVQISVTRQVVILTKCPPEINSSFNITINHRMTINRHHQQMVSSFSVQNLRTSHILFFLQWEKPCF
jgi:hypothetical protein